MGQQSVKVLAMIDLDFQQGRDALRGLMRYAQQHEPWRLLLPMARDMNRELDTHLFERADALVLRTVDPRVIDLAGRCGKPVVSLVAAPVRHLDIPVITGDGAAITRRGFEHLRSKSFERFGFFGYGEMNPSRSRRDVFRAACAEHRLPCGDPMIDRRDFTAGGAQVVGAKLARWLRRQEKPIGIMTPDDRLARLLAETCHTLGLAVPEEVGILGADNDLVFCESLAPTLSSVDPGLERMGLLAGQIIEQMLRGIRPEPYRNMLPPVGVVMRASTDVIASSDPLVREALSMIRAEASSGLTVAALADRFPLSRSAFERRFKAVVGRSPMQQVQRMRIASAKSLLRQTDLTVEAIAAACGFTSPKKLFTVFKRQTNLTPRQFRLGRQTQPSRMPPEKKTEEESGTGPLF